MTTTNNPAKVRTADAPNANGSTRVTTRRGAETRAFYTPSDAVEVSRPHELGCATSEEVAAIT
jgi:hypothetical protein